MQNSFGWATAGHGYKNKTFPAAVGETGSFFSTARAPVRLLMGSLQHHSEENLKNTPLNLGRCDVQAADVGMLTDMARSVFIKQRDAVCAGLHRELASIYACKNKCQTTIYITISDEEDLPS